MNPDPKKEFREIAVEISHRGVMHGVENFGSG